MADNFVAWPDVVNDDGSLAYGTPFSKEYNDAVRASITDNVYSAANPTVKTKTIIEEVIAARGSKTSVDARLDESMNEDGTLKPVAGQATQTQVVQGLPFGNWVGNDTFLIWQAGDAASPHGWVLTGAGASVARCGTGLADTNNKVGPFCVRITRAAADVAVARPLLNSTSFSASGTILRGRSFGFGCWVKCSVANMARVRLSDGVTSTPTTYHTGDGTWQFLAATHTLSGSATELSIILDVNNSSGDAYFSGATAFPSAIAPADWIPCPVKLVEQTFSKAGNLTAASSTYLNTWKPWRSMLIREVVLEVVTAPATTSIQCQLHFWDGSAFQPVFTTKPTIAASAKSGGASPDGTYRYRCPRGGFGADETNCKLAWTIDQVGTGTTGADLTVTIRGIQIARPQEVLLDVGDG